MRLADEQQFSVYNFEEADVAALWQELDLHEREVLRLLSRFHATENKERFPVLPAYDRVLKCSNLFNVLDARGAISVTERVGIIGRIRKLALGVAEAWVEQSEAAKAVA